MAPRKSIWYHLGHAYERARLASPDAEVEEPGASERLARRAEERRADLVWPSGDELLAAGAWLVLDRVVGFAGRGRRPGITGLVKAGAAGAAAALLVDLVRPLLHGDAELPVLDEDTAARMISVVAVSLKNGALVEPRVPGPALVKGALYGSAEYATDQLGGLSAILGAHSPQGRIPLLGELLDGVNPHDRAYLEHLVFGIALALLYESSPASNGTRGEPDEVGE